jgi:hypothetical protein
MGLIDQAIGDRHGVRRRLTAGVLLNRSGEISWTD